MSSNSNNLSFTPFNTTPGTNKLIFENNSSNANEEENNAINDNSLNFGSRTPFQVIPIEFDSLKKYNFNDSSKSSTIFNSGGDTSSYSMLNSASINITSSKLKMPQVERRAKRHFHESFMDSFDNNMINDYSGNRQANQSTLKQPIPTSMLLNKVGKQKSGLTRSAGHLNLSLNNKLYNSKNDEDLPIISANDIDNKHKTINDKIAEWSPFPNVDQITNQKDISLQNNSSLKNIAECNISEENSIKNDNHLNFEKSENQNYAESNDSTEQKEKNQLNLNLGMNHKEITESLYSSNTLDSANTEQTVFSISKNNRIFLNNKSGVSPLPTASSLWPSSADSNGTFKPWNTNITSPMVETFTDIYNKVSSNQDNFIGIKHRKTSTSDSEKQGSSNPSFIDSKPDQTIFGSNKLVSKISLDPFNGHERTTSGSYLNNSNLQETSYTDSLISDSSSNSRTRRTAVPDTPIKKPPNNHLNSDFLNNRVTIFEEEDENMDKYEEPYEDNLEVSNNENSLKLLFQHSENKNVDIYKRSPTNMNNVNRSMRANTVIQRNSKVFHKPNNSVTTITTINSNLSIGGSVDTQNSINRKSVIIGSDLNGSLQRLTDDLYGNDDIMDIENSLERATPTKKSEKLILIDKPKANLKNQFSTPQKTGKLNNTNNSSGKKTSLLNSNLKNVQTTLQEPISLEYRSATPTTAFISPDSKHATSILVKNSEDDMHYAYLITKFSKVEEVTNAGSFAKVFKVTKNLSNSKSLEKKGLTADIFAVKCMSTHNNKGTYLNVLNEIHTLQTISKYRVAYKNKLHDQKRNHKKKIMDETPVRYASYASKNEGEDDDDEEIQEEEADDSFHSIVDESGYIFDFITSWKHNDGYYIISDYYENGTLNDFIQKQIVNKEFKFDDFRIWKIIVEVCHGLNFIHKHCKIVHLDLKPSNIFVTFEGSLKIGDFGLSTRLPLKGKHFENEGDREYIAPEIIQESIYDFRADIFSLGLMIVELACNVVLPDNGQVWQRLRSGNISDIGRISSTEINKLLNDTSEPKMNNNFENSRLTPLSSASNFIGVSKLNEIERNTGKSIPAWVPKFLIDGISLEKTVRWMLDPYYKKRPTAKEILLTEECEYVGMSKKSGAIIFEGDFGPKLDRF